ncbi:MAG: TerC family protein [Pirellulaceae bacterium]
MLVVLQAVLGFDNLLYISLESKRVEESKQSYVRKMGVGLAILLRIVLLVVLLVAIDKLQDPFFTTGLVEVTPDAAVTATDSHDADHSEGHEGGHAAMELTEAGRYFAASINVHSLVVLIGGIFIIYTAFKEILHMLHIHHGHTDSGKDKKRGVQSAIFWITLMNLVFSFDSILSAIALTKNVWVMTTAIIISGVLMIVMADHVSAFLQKNRMYEVLGLFILFIVGILLVTEGAHLAHLHFFSYEIQPMAKATFYFVIAILVVVDVIQSRYQKKLLAEAESQAKVMAGQAQG